MDFSPLKEAVAAKSYEKIADICDELMLQVTAQGNIAYQQSWPYAIHLLGHIYVNDINSARFLWKLIPSSVKETQPEVAAAWKIGQQLWLRDYAGVYEAIRGFNWSPEAQGLVNSYSEMYTERIVPAASVCIFNSKRKGCSTVNWNERGRDHQVCRTTRLARGFCFRDADCEEAADCERAETRPYEATTLN